MTDLRDRIAAALFRSDWRDQRDWHTATDEFKKSYRDDSDAVIAALGGMEVLRYLEVPQRVMVNETRPDNILAIRVQALDRVQELIWPEEQDWPESGPPMPSREQWDRIVEAAFPPPPMAGASGE